MSIEVNPLGGFAKVKSVRIDRVISRACVCGHPSVDAHSPAGTIPQPWDHCPNCGRPARREVLPPMFWYRNPIRRWWAQLIESLQAKEIVT